MFTPTEGWRFGSCRLFFFQGVSYETGIPQQADENACPTQKSFSTSQPSFTIHEDTCLSMGTTSNSQSASSNSTGPNPLSERLSKPLQSEEESIEDIDPSVTELQR